MNESSFSTENPIVVKKSRITLTLFMLHQKYYIVLNLHTLSNTR